MFCAQQLYPSWSIIVYDAPNRPRHVVIDQVAIDRVIRGAEIKLTRDEKRECWRQANLGCGVPVELGPLAKRLGLSGVNQAAAMAEHVERLDDLDVPVSWWPVEQLELLPA